MMTGRLSVTLRKCFRSDFSRHGNWPLRPMTLLSPIAATSTIFIATPRGSTCSYRHRRFDVRMRVVAFNREILVAEAENILHRRVELHHRQRARRARQLQARLLQVIEIKMRVAEGVHEVA